MGVNSEQFLALSWSLVIICLVIVATRLSVRTRLRQWSYWVSDALLVLSLLCFAVLAAGDTYKFTLHGSIIGRPPTETFAKWQFAASIIFYAQSYLPRFSLLAFYYELFPLSEPKLRICLQLSTVFTVAAFLATTFLDIFWCGLDVSRNWSRSRSACSAAETPIIMYINWTIGISSELLVFLLPFPLLRRLKMLTKRERFGLTSIFLLGAITLAVSTVRMIMSIRAVLTLDSLLVISFENGTQIMVVALPALRPLFGMVSSSYKKRRAAREKDTQSPGGGSVTGQRQVIDTYSTSGNLHSDRGLLEHVSQTFGIAESSRVNLHDSREEEPCTSTVLSQYPTNKR